MQKFLNFVLIFLILFLGMQLIFPKAPAEQAAVGADFVITAPREFTTGKEVVLQLRNNTAAEIQLASGCPEEPFVVSYFQNGEWLPQAAATDAEKCSTEPFAIPAGATLPVSYQHWQRELFTAPGEYRIEIPVMVAGAEKVFTHNLTVSAPGFFGQIWREVFYRPIYNGLIFLTKITGSSFGWGIVLLTLLIRIILLHPFQKSLKAQREMQKIQPELDRIKEKYKNNQQMIAMETMALFKQHKVSPFSSCLPVLIQMPFLLAVFWIVQAGLGENNFVLLYDFLTDFDFHTVSTAFAGLDLLGPGAQFYFLPALAVGVLQFIQMKLAFLRTKKQQSGAKANNPMADAMKNMGQMMQYFLPVMIAVFTATLPLGVGLYWLTSTAFGVGQQLVVNRQVK